MVMLNTSPGLSPEYENAKRRVNSLRDEYADLLAEYAELTGTVRPNLETEYMMTVGRKEHQLFSMQVEIRRLKREIALYQAALNRGEHTAPEAVKRIIEREFAEYLEQLEEQRKKVREAELLFGTKKLSPEESKAVRKLYHDLVRKLHPDLNPELPPQAAELWHRIVEAYKSSDWKALHLLADMTEEFFAGRRDAPGTPATLELLREQQDRLEKKIKGLRETIQEIQTRPPFTFRELLSDPDKVARRRRELDRQMEFLENHLAEVRKIRDGLRGA